MTWIMLAALAATVATAFGRGYDILSPSRIYICVYAILLSIYHLNLSRLQTPWSISTILLFYGASGMFLVAGLWIWLLGRIKTPEWRLDFKRIKESLARDSEGVDWVWFAKVYTASILVFLGSYVVSFFVVGGVPVFMSDPDGARIKFFTATMLTNYGIFMGPISLMLGVVLLLFSSPGKIVRRRIILSLALVLGLYMLIVTRYDLFRFLIFAVVLFHYGKGRLKLSHIIAGLTFAVGVFFLAFLIRVNTDAIASFNEMIKVKMPAHLSWASNIYAYLANDFWNFDFAVKKFVDGDHRYPLQYGMGLFRALIWNLRLEGGLIEAYNFDSLFNESATKIDGLNTVVYVWHFYKDFGIAGAFLLPFIAGLFAWKFYLNSMMAPTVFRLSLWGVFSGAIALSFHTPLWELWFLYLNIIVLAVAHRKLRLT